MQGRDLVVERVTALVEPAQALRERVGDERFVDVHYFAHRRGRAQLLQQIEEPPAVAVCVADDEPARPFAEGEILERVSLCTVEQLAEFGLA